MEHKSKEEILAAKDWNSQYPNYMAEHEILDAMDDWAEQVAISFAEWLSNHKLDFQPANGGRWIGIDMKVVSAQDLYAEFLTHKSI